MPLPGLSKARADRLYGAKVLPANVGSRAAGFDPSRSVYNLKPSNTVGTRAGLAAALTGTAPAPFIFEGDSKIAGVGSNGAGQIIGAQALPGMFRRLLAGKGYVAAGTGFVMANQGGAASGGDSRWTYGGTWAPSANKNNHFAACGTTGNVLTFTSDLPGEVVRILAPSNSSPLTISVDGSTPANGSGSVAGGGTYASGVFTLGGSNTQNTLTISGLSNTAHVVTITSSGAGSAWYVLAVSCGHANGIDIHNIGISGSTTTDWNNILFYQSKTVSQGMPAVTVFLSLGVNDARASVPIATYKTNMGALITGHLSARDVILIVPSPPRTTDVTQVIWDSYVSAMYDLADTYDLPLIDLTAAYQSWIIGNSKGYYTDNLHETALGYAANAIIVTNGVGA